jgi:hypothetical protein
MRRMTAEDGSVAIIVGLLLVVLVGIGALVLDVGNLYWERRQLQNGADAAAFAAAQELAPGGAEADAFVWARTYANANNSRGAFIAPEEFVTSPTSVTVTARTGSQEAEGELSSLLAGVLGVDAYATSARATVSWDSNFGGGRGIPIAICQANWSHFTEDGTKYGPPPIIIRFAVGLGITSDEHDADCGNPGNVGNSTYPGGFAFLEREDDCMAVTNEGDLFPGKTGNNPHIPGSECPTDAFYAMLRGVIDNEEEVFIPIFYDYIDQGTSGQFRIMGYAGFRLTGYRMLAGPAEGGNRIYGDITAAECGGGRSCLKGWYTNFYALDGLPSTGTGPGFGAQIFTLVE